MLFLLLLTVFVILQYKYEQQFKWDGGGWALRPKCHLNTWNSFFMSHIIAFSVTIKPVCYIFNRPLVKIIRQWRQIMRKHPDSHLTSGASAGWHNIALINFTIAVVCSDLWPRVSRLNCNHALLPSSWICSLSRDIY